MTFHLSGRSGAVAVALALFVPAVLTAHLLHSAKWLIIVPVVIAAFAILVAMLPLRRKVTPEQFADELERHLLGTEGEWDWDDTTSVAIADERLERIRLELSRFDSLGLEKDKDELRAIIAALRRGQLPEAVRPTHLTYKNR